MSLDGVSVRVNRRTIEAEGIISLELVSVDGSALPPFSAGSHIDVRLPTGVRQYSLCNAPSEQHRYLLAVLHEPEGRGGSADMYKLTPGSQIEISAPKNHFEMAARARRSILFAGGIGVTPILCMAERLANTSGDFIMHYCTRSRARTTFMDRIGSSGFRDHVAYHFDDEADEQKLRIAEALGDRSDGTHVYVCGPSGFMNAVLETARAAGWPEDQLHYEYFAASPIVGDASEFLVKLASSGGVIPVKPDQTIVEALMEHGVEVEVSCEQGVCGTCLTRVLDGVPDHRDMFLTAAEHAKNDQILPCCSRAKSPLLVLDI